MSLRSLVVAGLLLVSSAAAHAAPPLDDAHTVPWLVVLAPTGETREGLPVLTRHPAAAAHEAVLTRGFSGRLLRLFRWEQQFLARRDGTAIEPAYLLLSRNQGGFPRFGFWLDEARKAGVGYVDLHEGSDIAGRFGAMDQIFPHELVHVIVQQLADPPPPGAGGANQVHAIGVRTDRITAFHEGFAEAVQVLAIDDDDAVEATRPLGHDAAALRAAQVRLNRYRRALEARWSLAPPPRLGFVLWFSPTEQVLRYHAVKANAFAREVAIPPRLLAARDRYPAYLAENTLPGAESGPPKSTPRLLATEGVVATLFSRWLRDPVLQQAANDPAFYERFGIAAGEATPLDHAFLKLFAVLADRRPHDAAGVLTGYATTFPGEAAALERLARQVGIEGPLLGTPEIWLANDRFTTGTTLFDQYRALPRVHTFDLNAASLVDLMTVEGIGLDVARAIQARAPFSSIDEIAAVPGATPALVARLAAMRERMTRLREDTAGEDIESLDLLRLFRPVFVRAGVWIVVAAVAAAFAYRLVRRLGWLRLALNGTAAALVGLLLTWVLGAALQTGSGPVASAWFPFVPLALFGAPGALWQWARRRSAAGALRVLGAWALACLPALLITQPL